MMKKYIENEGRWFWFNHPITIIIFIMIEFGAFKLSSLTGLRYGVDFFIFKNVQYNFMQYRDT